jgi:excisionase family DNA binding protein
MEKTVLISMPMEDFQSVIIDCVSACLLHYKPQSTTTHPTETDHLLSIKQAAALLCLSVPTLYGYVHRAEIPVCKRGNRLYFTKADLMKWVEAGRKFTSKELDSSTNDFLTKTKGASHGK